MIDNQDPNDEINTISQRLKTVTTIDNNIVTPHQQQHSGMRQTNLQNKSAIVTNTPIMNKSLKTDNLSDVIRPDEDDGPVRNLPELNVPERIVIIIDITREQNCTKFKLGTGATYMPMFMIKRVVEIFIGAKSMIKRTHEFALMTISQDSIEWVCNFTCNVKTVLNFLDSLAEEPVEDEENKLFDLGKVFEILNDNVDLQKYTDPNDPPSYITRAILIYCRSNCIPKFITTRKYFALLTEHPYFVLDALFVHEPPSADNKCEEVYNELTALDAKSFSYILEVGRNATKLHDNMAKLLAHPLQRPLQRNASYNMTASGSSAKENTD